MTDYTFNHPIPKGSDAALSAWDSLAKPPPFIGDTDWVALHKDLMGVISAEEHWGAAAETESQLGDIVRTSLRFGDTYQALEQKAILWDQYVSKLRTLAGIFRFSTATREGLIEILKSIASRRYSTTAK